MTQPISISDRLRERRTALGLSLAELARLADTSAATLSRYENGWTRFEVATLRKLAAALGCRLRIELEPVEPSGSPDIAEPEAIRRLGRLFWDADLTMESLAEYPVWAVERVLEYGRLEDVHMLQALLGRESFLEAVQSSRRLTGKTKALWDGILGREGMACTRRSSPTAAWRS